MTDLVQSAEQSAALTSLRERERQLEIEARTVQARLEEVRDLIGMLENGGKKRTRKPRADAAMTDGENTGATT